MRNLRRTTLLTTMFVAFTLLLGACTHVHVLVLAHDDRGGRVPGTAGHLNAQNYLIAYLRAHGAEALDGTTDSSAFRQAYATGTNVVGRIPGTDLADEIVMIGAHYDHLAACDNQGGSPVCNGATDNAAGVAVVLEIAAALFDGPTAPRRTVMFGFWDQEESGLRGSGAWVDANPTIVADIVTYVNYDIQGANLLPTLANDTFAIGAESGGVALSSAVSDAGAVSSLDLALLSSVFGQGRSDYVHFLGEAVPTVFFGDATGSCYHTTRDTYEEALDPVKLREQTEIGVALVRDLASGATTPTFDNSADLATYDDLVAVHALVEATLPDLGLFTPAQQATLTAHEMTLQTLVDDGAALFDAADQTTLLLAALDLVTILASGDCDGHVP